MKKTVKKILYICMSVIIIMTLTACGGTKKKLIASWELAETEDKSGLFYYDLNIYEEGIWDYGGSNTGTWELDGKTLVLNVGGYQQNPNTPDSFRYTVKISGDQMTLTTQGVEGIYTKK